MSAFIVQDATINKIVAFIGSAPKDGEHYKYYGITKLFEDNGWAIEFPEHLERLAHALFQMNCDSIDGRYGDGQHKEFKQDEFIYKVERVHTPLEMVKIISCYQYQACEGDVPETNPLFNIMEELSHLICQHIVKHSPQYDALPSNLWD